MAAGSYIVLLHSLLSVQPKVPGRCLDENAGLEHVPWADLTWPDDSAFMPWSSGRASEPRNEEENERSAVALRLYCSYVTLLLLKDWR